MQKRTTTWLAALGPKLPPSSAYGFSSPAPSGGLSVALTPSVPAITCPATLTVPAGASSASVTVSALPVSFVLRGYVKVVCGGVTKYAMVFITPH